MFLSLGWLGNGTTTKWMPLLDNMFVMCGGQGPMIVSACERERMQNMSRNSFNKRLKSGIIRSFIPIALFLMEQQMIKKQEKFCDHT